jgi:hypothetical protein
MNQSMIESIPDIWKGDRYERKSVAHSIYYDTMVSWIMSQKMSFRPIYQKRLVQSLYFDSHVLDDFDDTMAGVGERRKVRLRWYGNRSDVKNATLEVKCKRNTRGVKLSYPIDLHTPLSEIPLDHLAFLISRQIPENIIPMIEHANLAVALVQYEREYFLSWDEKVRATMDRELRIFDQYEAITINDSRPSTFPDLAILELKYDSKLHKEVASQLEPLPMRLSRFSKYSTGVQRLLE